jgi:hypothetical protein
MFADRYQSMIRGEWTFSADGTKVLAPIEGGAVINNVRVFNASTLATHATNYVTFKLINMGTDAAGTTVIATASTSQTGGAAMAANVAFPLTITTANAAITDNSVLGFIYDESTTDVADNHAITVVVHYTPTQAPA